jgi:AraC family transcriptional regulator of adaptative response/methylated-DNA-[protein]-cysteine methyltransferase
MQGRESDYDRIARAIEFIVASAASQPRLDEIAAAVHMSPFHFQRLFSRWTGVTPKRFLQVLTVERAKSLLRQARPLLDVSESLGLSSSSRLHDHFVQLEAVTPGQYGRAGEGLSIEHGVHTTPFGPVFVAVTPRGVCKLSFVGEAGPETEIEALRSHWRAATFASNADATAAVVERIFASADERGRDTPLSLHVSGTNFQVNVWRALLQIPPGQVASYSEVAAAVGRPRAVRAVGRAVGSNPVSFLIPCHRVIRQSGELGGYYWGPVRKHAMHAWESARFG